MSTVIYVPRTFGSVLILTESAPVVVLPTVFVVANFRSGSTQAVYRDGEQNATFRDGQVTAEGR